MRQQFISGFVLGGFHFPKVNARKLRDLRGMPKSATVQDSFIKFLESLVDLYRYELRQGFPTNKAMRDVLNDVVDGAGLWTRVLKAIDPATARWLVETIDATRPDYRFERHLRQVLDIRNVAKRLRDSPELKSVPSGPRKEAQSRLVRRLADLFVRYELPIRVGESSLFVKVLSLTLEPDVFPEEAGSDTAHHLAKNLIKTLSETTRKKFPKSFPPQKRTPRI